MSVEIPGETIVVIIAIEEYTKTNKPNIKNVDYAENDARAFKELLVEKFEVKEDNIHYWLNEDALQTTVEHELPYIIKSLAPQDTFIFYYAGHGHFGNGHNYLTLYDSHNDLLLETSASFQKYLLGPLSKNPCERAFLFIDACATHLLDAPKARSSVSEMSEKEFKKYVDDSVGHACFFSCSPGQKSYPSENINHGIWTWHLLQAFEGAVIEAVERDNIITASSLKNYLSTSVPEYITKKTKIRGRQEPYSIISTNTELKILEVEGDKESFEDDNHVILKTDEYQLELTDSDSFKAFEGFNKKSNTVPNNHNSSAQSWAERLSQERIKEEIEEVYKKSKKLCGFRKRECEKDPDNGYLATPHFRYSIHATQSDEDCTQVKTSRILELRIDQNELPEEFDDIFPNRFEELQIPISGKFDFDELVEQFEDMETDGKGDLVDEDEKITFSPSDSANVSNIVITPKGITVHFSASNNTIYEMVESAQNAFGFISSPIKNLLE